MALAAVAVGRGAEASLTPELTCVLGPLLIHGQYLPGACTFFKSIYETTKTKNVGSSTRHSCIFKVPVQKDKGFLLYCWEQNVFLCSVFSEKLFLCSLSPLSVLPKKSRVSLHSALGQVLIWHSWYCTFARGSVVLAKQSEWWAAAQLLCEMGSAHTKQSPVNLLLFLFPTKRNRYISRMFKNCNNLYTLVNNRVTTSV